MAKVMSPVELLGLSATSEEGEIDNLFGEDPVHMRATGYAALAETLCRLLEDPAVTFVGEKRELEAVTSLPDGGEMGSWRRKHTEWIFSEVSGEGRGGGRDLRGGRGGQGGPRGGGDRGRGYGRFNPRAEDGAGGYDHNPRAEQFVNLEK